MPGVGKSYLADHFAKLHHSSFPGGCLRLPLSPDETRTTAELREILADLLEIPDHNLRQWNDLRRRLLTPSTLLHIENIDSEASANTAAAVTARLQGCRIIVTGRFQGLGRSAGWTRRLLAPFDEPTALAQLKGEFRAPATDEEHSIHCDLVRELGHLPLAIHLAAGYLHLEPSVSGFLALLRNRKLQLTPSDPADPLYQREPAKAVLSSTFELSLELLQKALGSDTTALMAGLRALGHAPLTGFGKSLGSAMAGIAPELFDRLMLRAHQLSIVESSKASQLAQLSRPTWRIHPILAELLRLSHEEQPVYSRMTEWFTRRLAVSARGQERWTYWKEVQEEAESLRFWLAKVSEKEDWLALEKVSAGYPRLCGPCGMWVEVLDKALRSHDLQPPQRAHFLYVLSGVALQAGDLPRAMTCASQSVEAYRKLNDPVGIIEASHTQAEIYSAQGMNEEALHIWKTHVLPILGAAEDDRIRSAVLLHIGETYARLGDYDSALRIWREQVLPLTIQLGEEQERGILQGHIAGILIRRGDCDSAIELLRNECLPANMQSGCMLWRKHTQAAATTKRLQLFCVMRLSRFSKNKKTNPTLPS
jgi:tetratricopeptide (TPR) repeat protein